MKFKCFLFGVRNCTSRVLGSRVRVWLYMQGFGVQGQGLVVHARFWGSRFVVWSTTISPPVLEHSLSYRLHVARELWFQFNNDIHIIAEQCLSTPSLLRFMSINIGTFATRRTAWVPFLIQYFYWKQFQKRVS